MSDEIGRRGFGFALLLGVLGVAAYGGAQKATGPVVSGKTYSYDRIYESPHFVRGTEAVSGVSIIT
jgi:hypothetical protein